MNFLNEKLRFGPRKLKFYFGYLLSIVKLFHSCNSRPQNNGHNPFDNVDIDLKPSREESSIICLR